MENETEMAAFLQALERLDVHHRVSVGPRAIRHSSAQLYRSLAAACAAVLEAGPQAHVEVLRSGIDAWIVKVTWTQIE